jgi:hypothetical protein
LDPVPAVVEKGYAAPALERCLEIGQGIDHALPARVLDKARREAEFLESGLEGARLGQGIGELAEVGVITVGNEEGAAVLGCRPGQACEEECGDEEGDG